MFFYEFFLDPFLSFEFMRRSLIACLALSLGCGPVGTLLVLRRMSLIGDALSHAVLPGAAIGFMIAGLSLVSMSIGGFIAGILVALLSGFISRLTQQREDASFAAFYLISLAIGVLIISMFGSNVDIMHVLFGTILAIDNESLFLVVSITSLTLLTFAIVGRGLVIESFDPGFLKVVNGPGATLHLIFLTLVVLNLVAGFQALGTLMAVGLMMLPAVAARFWAQNLLKLSILSIFFAFISGYSGLLISYHSNLPSGPTIILVAGFIYLFSVFFGFKDSLITKYISKPYLER